MAILYPKCPRCGGKSKSAIEEPEWLGHAVHASHHPLTHAAKHNPLITVAVGIGALGYAAYRRVPGGGKKQCESCYHQFY